MGEPIRAKKARCEDCGGTGLIAHPDNVTALCPCPAGDARDRAKEGIWD